MAYRLSNGHVTDDVTWPWKDKLVSPLRLERNISKTTWARDLKFDTRLCMGNAEQAHNKFPSKWTWPRWRDPTIFGSTVGYPSDSLASCSSLDDMIHDDNSVCQTRLCATSSVIMCTEQKKFGVSTLRNDMTYTPCQRKNYNKVTKLQKFHSSANCSQRNHAVL